MVKIITWSLHTEVGHWNTSYLLHRIGDYLNYLANYKDIYFTRTNNGRIKFILSASHSLQTAAWTNRSFECRINSRFNFGVGLPREYYCAQVACHEFGHMALPNGVGGNVHSTKTGLMHPGCWMATGNLEESDYPWFSAYPWRSFAGFKFPHQEPGRMKQTFMPGVKAMEADAELEATGIELKFGCDHQPGPKRPWYDIRPERWVVP